MLTSTRGTVTVPSLWNNHSITQVNSAPCLLSDPGHFHLQQRVCGAVFSRLHRNSWAEVGEGPGRATCHLSWPSEWLLCETELLCHAGGAFPSPAVPQVTSRCKVHHPWALASIRGDLPCLVPSPDTVKGLSQCWLLTEKSVTRP